MLHFMPASRIGLRLLIVPTALMQVTTCASDRSTAPPVLLCLATVAFLVAILDGVVGITWAKIRLRTPL